MAAKALTAMKVHSVQRRRVSIRIIRASLAARRSSRSPFEHALPRRQNTNVVVNELSLLLFSFALKADLNGNALKTVASARVGA